MMNKKNLFILLFCINCIPGYCDNGAFVSYFADYSLSKRIGIHFDGNGRFLSSFIGSSYFMTLRLGINYTLNPKQENALIQVSAGYALKQSYFGNVQQSDSIGNIIGEYNFIQTNHIIWQQVQIKHTFGRQFKLYNRLRTEQDFKFNNALAKTAYMKSFEGYSMTRLRYMIRPEIYLLKEEKTISPYISIQEELFIKLHSSNPLDKLIQENRISFNIGLSFKKATQIEIGYMNNAFIQNAISNQINFIQLQVIQNLNFYKSKNN